jgi:ribosome-associated protein
MTLEKVQALVIQELEELKAKDISVFDVSEVTAMTDAMIICTGTSNRHVKSIAENLISKMKEENLQPVGVEGGAKSEWILVDLNYVIVHVMLAETRDFYQLDKLWDPRFAEEASEES